MEKADDKLWKNLVILCVFVGVVAVTAEVDWAATQEVEIGFRIAWLYGVLLTLGIILPIAFIYLAGNKIRERGESEKTWFIIALVLYAVASGIPPIFYIVLEQAPGFLLFLQLGLFGLVPAFILQPKSLKTRYSILIILFAAVLIPLAILVNSVIGDKFMYYLSFWGLFCTFFYLLIAIGWKFGGGTRRQSWNIFIAGTLIQYSTLEDFLYFLLNGQPLPGTWPWMKDFVINLEALFGHIPTDFDLLIFCLIITAIAVFVLFDAHGYIWDRHIKKK